MMRVDECILLAMLSFTVVLISDVKCCCLSLMALSTVVYISIAKNCCLLVT